MSAFDGIKHKAIAQNARYHIVSRAAVAQIDKGLFYFDGELYEFERIEDF